MQLRMPAAPAQVDNTQNYPNNVLLINTTTIDNTANTYTQVQAEGNIFINTDKDIGRVVSHLAFLTASNFIIHHLLDFRIHINCMHITSVYLVRA